MAGLLNVGEMAALAIHEMVELAIFHRQNPDARLTIQDLADRLDASVYTLQKVTRRLIALNLVDGTRGAKGGLKLSVSPDKVTLLGIIEGVDGKVDCNRCLFGKRICAQNKRCIFDKLTRILENEVREYLSGTTLEELCRKSSNTIIQRKPDMP